MLFLEFNRPRYRGCCIGHGNQTIEFENWHHAKIATKSLKVATKTTQWSESDFNQINVDVKNIDVVIQTGDAYNVKFVGSPDTKFKVSKKDQTLTVKQTNDATKGYRMRTNGFFWIFYHKKHADSQLIITVPKNTQLSNVSVNETNVDLPRVATLWLTKQPSMVVKSLVKMTSIFMTRPLMVK